MHTGRVAASSFNASPAPITCPPPCCRERSTRVRRLRQAFFRALRKTLCALAFSLPWLITARADPQLLSQYGHSAWRVQDGAFGSPNALTQTADGYVWIGTSAGLVRFDGVRFVPWNTFAEGSIGPRRIVSLFAAKDGSLWLGSSGRVARIKDGHLKQYDTAGQTRQFVEDDDGTIWLVQINVNGNGGPLCKIAAENVQCFGKPAIPVPNASVVSRTGDAGFWLGSSGALCRWLPGRAADCFLEDALKPLEGLMGVTALLSGRDGTLWVGIGKGGRDLGLGRLADGSWKSFSASGLDGSSLSVSALLEDREGSLWVGTFDRGLYRIGADRVEHYGFEDGLSSNTVSSGGLYEDREGLVWVATSASVDTFRHLASSVFSQGPPHRPSSTASAHRGDHGGP